jgi:hypothetical protein
MVENVGRSLRSLLLFRKPRFASRLLSASGKSAEAENDRDGHSAFGISCFFVYGDAVGSVTLPMKRMLPFWFS